MVVLFISRQKARQYTNMDACTVHFWLMSRKKSAYLSDSCNSMILHLHRLRTIQKNRQMTNNLKVTLVGDT